MTFPKSFNFFKAFVDVIEIDPAIARVAKEQFAFAESERLKLKIDDGIRYINNFSGGKCKVLVYSRKFKKLSLTTL